MRNTVEVPTNLYTYPGLTKGRARKGANKKNIKIECAPAWSAKATDQHWLDFNLALPTFSHT